jgi:hypothetical protein
MFKHNFRLTFYKRTLITPDVSYGCETGPPVLTDEQSLNVLKNGVMRKIL